MRGIWQLAILSAVAGAILVVTGFLLLERGGNDKSSQPRVTTPAPNISYGNANISAKTLGGPYRRTVVVRVKNKRSGIPVQGADVTIHGEMIVPHLMVLYEKKLPEVARGEYKGPYTLIMPGDWRVVIVATSKKGDTSTYSLPLKVRG